MTDEPTRAPSDLDAYVAIPRLSGLRLSPDGERIAVGVATLDAKKQKYVTALWEVDPAGRRPARRLTRGAKGESGAAFTPAGDLLFTATRPGDGDDDAPAALWLLPAGGGEARIVATRPGGVSGATVARTAGTVVLSSSMLPSSVDLGAEEAARKARKDGAVSAVLHEGYPVRHWDEDLGPDRPRLFAAASLATGDDARYELRDLTGHGGRALDVGSWDVTADGRTIVTSWNVAEPAGSERPTLVAIDVESGERQVLADDPAYEYENPVISPDGTQVALVASARSTPTTPGDSRLAVVPIVGGPIRELTATWDRWPREPRWTPDGASIVVVADDGGRAPVFRVQVATGQVSPVTGDMGAYTDVCVSPDGRWVYALRSSVDSPPAPVRVPLDVPGAAASEPLLSPVEAVTPAGTLTEVTATADDGEPLRAWLALPDGASAADPAPLLLCVHGGPLGSWNAWSWRWNPWLATARGYAVLLPDPALSTGYGLDFVRRGWGAWGQAPYTDLMAVTDAALERDDLDAGRTAAMGGSFGGYMANWIAGHTDRFDAIVTHASLWALDQFGHTTDAAFYWQREMTPEMAQANSPHLHADSITTPMLVTHGDKDYRVPIGEGLRLWYDLVSRSEAKDGSTPHKLLYYPDEHHWVLAPGNAKVWYDTVFAFLDQHVLGRSWNRPELLG